MIARTDTYPECTNAYMDKTASSDYDLQTAFEACTCKTCWPKIVLKDSEGGPAKFFVDNTVRAEVLVTRIDPCIQQIADEKKCDFAVSFGDEVHYVELKGCDHSHGCAQLLSVLSLFESVHKRQRRFFHLAAQPPASRASIQRHLIAFARKKAVLDVDKQLTIQIRQNNVYSVN